MKKIVIIGATSAIAAQCARVWLQQGAADLVLAGRDRVRLERLAADLAARSPASHIVVEEIEFHDPAAIDEAVARMVGPVAVDIALVAHGNLPVQADCESDLAAARAALEVNGVSPALFAQAFAKHMATANRGTLALIGSVAGDRGRQSNYVYGAAKGLLERCAQGLQHRFAGTPVRIVLVKPGPTDTPMTAHLKEGGARLAPVEDVARAIVGAIERGQAVVYVPGKWWLIMMVIRHLPWFIFRRLKI